MRRGIYRFETTISQTSSEGVAMISNNGIRGPDNDYVYTGSQVAKNGKRGWSFSAERYGKSGPRFSIRRFSAMVYGEEGEREFRLSGESDADANTKVAIHGRWVAVSRRGFDNTQPKPPFLNHFDLWLSTQSLTSTTPTIPPLSNSDGTEIPCLRSTHSILPAYPSRLKLACISNGRRRLVRHERFSISFRPLTISQAHGWRTDNAGNWARLGVHRTTGERGAGCSKDIIPGAVTERLERV
jgi:hypothetical protein